MIGDSWHYMEFGHENGPVPEESLLALLNSGFLPWETLVRREGQADLWLPAREALAAAAPGVSIPAAATSTAPPTASASPEFESEQGAGGGTRYFPVSTKKFVVMEIFSLGIYEAWWIFMSWRRHKRRTGENISPFWRTVFSVFFIYGLLKRIRDDADYIGDRPAYSAEYLALAWIILTVFSGTLGGAGGDTVIGTVRSILGLLTILCLLPAVRAVNTLNKGRVTAAQMNAGFSAWNKSVIVIGSLLWIGILADLIGKVADKIAG